MNFLLDTCVLSELVKRTPNNGVVNWISSIDENRLFISVITLGEIQKGISKLEDRGRQETLSNWLEQALKRRFDQRCLTINTDIALEWGMLSGGNAKQGRTLPVIDALLAATAIVHNLTFITRNESDFNPLPIRVINPWT